MTKISELPAAGALADANELVIVQAGTTNKITYETLRDAFRAANRWQVIDATKYTVTPPTTSSITMSDTGDMAVGLPVKYRYNNTTYYGRIKTVNAATSIVVQGAALDTNHDLQGLWIGTPEMVIPVTFFVSGTYGDGTGDLLAADMKTYFRWLMSTAYLVYFEATHETIDTGTEPKINVKVNGTAVSSADSGNGIQLGAAGTWVGNGDVEITANAYDVNPGEAVEINCSAAGGTGDAENLTVTALFVLG